MRPKNLRTCRRCGEQFQLTLSGERYCSDECQSAARKEYMRRYAKSRYRRMHPIRWAARIKDDSPRIVGNWRRSETPRRDKSGCGYVVSYNHLAGPFRVLHYLSIGELPFVAFCGIKPIGRFATLANAKAACERDGKKKEARRSP